MKEFLLALSVSVSALFMVGCTTQNNQSPYLSVTEFLSKRDQFEGQSVAIKGKIEFKYECPSCPEGAMCKLCFNYLTLTDLVWTIRQKASIVINFNTSSAVINDVYQKLKTGDVIVVNVKYNSSPTSPMVSNNKGYFKFESLTTK